MNENFTGIIDGSRLQSIEIDRHIRQPIDGEYSAAVRGQLTYAEVFEMLKSHLKAVGMISESSNWLQLSENINPDEYIPKDWKSFDFNITQNEKCIRMNIFLNRDNGDVENFIKAEYPSTDAEDFVNVSRIAAQCSLMLNGNGCVYNMPQDITEWLTQCTETEMKLARSGLVNPENENIQHSAAAVAGEIERHNAFEDNGLVCDDGMEL